MVGFVAYAYAIAAALAVAALLLAWNAERKNEPERGRRATRILRGVAKALFAAALVLPARSPDIQEFYPALPGALVLVAGLLAFPSGTLIGCVIVMVPASLWLGRSHPALSVGLAGTAAGFGLFGTLDAYSSGALQVDPLTAWAASAFAAFAACTLDWLAARRGARPAGIDPYPRIAPRPSSREQ